MNRTSFDADRRPRQASRHTGPKGGSGRAGGFRLDPERAAGVGSFVLQAVELMVETQAGTDFDRLLARYQALVRPLGFRYVAMMTLVPENPRTGLRFTTFPPAMIARYERQNHWDSDPILQAALSDTVPRLWSEAIVRAGLSSIDDVPLTRSFGIVDGMTIPLACPGRPAAVMLLAADRALRLDAETRKILCLASNVFAARIEPSATAASSDRLTSREREVLRLTADGHSARDIGDRLATSQNTITRHLSNIRSKLRATNTVHAVAIALKQNLLSA